MNEREEKGNFPSLSVEKVYVQILQQLVKSRDVFKTDQYMRYTRGKREIERREKVSKLFENL